MRKNSFIYFVFFCFVIPGCNTRSDAVVLKRSTIVLFYDTAFYSDAASVSEMHLLEFVIGSREGVFDSDNSFVYISSDSDKVSLESVMISKNKGLVPNRKNFVALFPKLDKEISFSYHPDSIVINRVKYLTRSKVSYGLTIGHDVIEIVPNDIEIIQCPKENNEYMCVGKELYESIHW